MTSLPLHQGHIADNISTPGGDASLLYPPLTPKREVELRAKGRQLLDEHRREVAEKGLPYTAEEVALMREQGRELLRASREAAAANGGHHVPAPLLSAAVRAAAAPAHPSRLLIDASGVSFEGGRSGATQSTSEPTQQPYDNGAMTSPLNTQQSATVDGGIPCAREKPTFSDSTAVQLPSSPAHLQDLLEEVQRLQSLVAAQEAQLHAQQSSAGLTTEELLTKSHVDALRKSLIEQFNEHMAQCEQANQTYWEKVTAQHQREVCALQAECAQHKQRAAEAEALAQGQQSKHDARNEESSDVTATLRLDVTRLEGELQLARQQSSDAQTARDSLAATATHLSSTVEAQRAMIIQLQQELSSANTQLQAVREEAQHALNENERALNASRLEILNLHTSLRERIAELEAANAELQAACASAASAAPPAHDGANPFADAEDPFGGPPRVVAPAVGDAELDAARQRIAELEAANAELQAACASAAAAAPPAHDGANPFADAEDPFAGPPRVVAPAVGDAELDAARQRIAELEAANAELDAARQRIAELEAANAELQAACASAAAAAPPAHDGANPFADAEDPFGDPPRVAAPAVGDAELDAARRRIAELEAANAELQAACASAAAAAPPAHDGANPFADAEDPFAGPPRVVAPAVGDAELDAARQRIAELEAANAELQAACASAAAAAPPAHDGANPFADAEDPFGGPPRVAAPAVGDAELDAARRRIAELEAANVELDAARRRIAELEAANAELDAARQRIAELEAANAELQAACASAPAAAPPAHDGANPFADAEDPFAGPPRVVAPAVGDAELDAARQRIAELEAANAELQAACASAAAAASPAHDGANPFADAEDPFGGPPRVVAPAVGDAELDAARQRIAELEAANAELQAACASAAAAAPPAHDGANPFADAEDPFGGPPRVVAPAVGDAELDAARQRIAELEAANAELQVANESAGRAWRECLAKLDAERQVVVDLEDALDVAAGDLEGLHEDLEEKSRLIQALRAGEAALGCLSVDTTGSIGANGWTLAPSPEKARKGMCEGGSENSAEVLHVLRCRVADLTHELETMRHQQEGMSVSAMVPGMEALGRQYAEHERRLVLAEEARAALEEEVQRLRGKATSVSGRWMSEDGRDREGSGEQASSLDGRNAHTTAMETPPASLVDPLHVPPNGDGAEGGMVSSAVQPPHVSTTMKLQSAPENFACSKGGSTPTGSATRLVTRDKQTPASLPAMPVAALSEGPKQNEGECGRSASLTLASLNGSRDCQASRRGGVIPGTLRHESGDGEGLISAEEDVACQWAASSCMVLSAPDRDSEVCDAVSTGWNNEVDFNLPHRCSRDIDVDGDEDDVNTEACNVSISTRVTALHGRQGAHNAAVEERVDDSSVTMQELGRRYADAQQRLYSSEEARQSLEVGVEGLQTVVTRQPQRMSPGVCASRAVGNEADPLTVTTSFASSVPTAARERPIKQGCPGKNASPPTTTSSRPGGGDDAESGSFGSALYSEPGVSVTTTAAPAHDDGSGGRQNRLATATIEDTAALHERIVELENRLSDMEAQHEEELQALAEAAADRIEAIEEQYAEDLAAAQKTAATAGEGCQANLETTTSLMRQVRQLTESLADARSAHAAELRTLREEHEVLLQRRLSEQENSFEAVIWKLDQQHRDQLRILASAGETGGHALTGEEGVVGTALSSLPPEEDKRAQYWEEQHATLLKRFEQLQREYDALTYGTGAQQRSCYEEGADRQEQPQSRAVRDAAAAQLETLHRRLEEMDKVVKAAQTDAQDRSDELRDFTARHAEHEAALRAELDNLRSQVQSAHDELARANNLNEELSELLQQGATSVETAMRERDAQHTALEQQVQQLKQQLAMAEDRLADRQAALQEQGVNADALQRRLFEMEEEKRAAEARLREGQRNAEEAERATVNAANRAARDAEQARVAVQEAMVQEHATHKQEIAALHRELDELRAELEAAQTVAATVPLEVQRHQRDLGTVRDRLTEALRSQQELQQELKSSRAEVERQRLLLMREGIGNSTDADDCGTSPSLDAHLNALLHRNEELGERLRDAASEQDRLQEERDRLSMQVKSAARVVEVKEQAMRRQEAELRSVRSQLSTVRDDLSQRVQTNHALQVEIDHLQERLEDTTNAYEKLQGIHMETVSKSGMLGHAVALLTAKAVTIPRALEEYVEVVLSAYNTLLQTASRDRRHIYDRCDLIEKAAAEAMAEAEEQNRVYEAAIADAQEEQQQMKEIIEGLQQAVQKAEEAKIAAVADATAARSDLEATRRQAREDVFNAQRDLQAAELRQADTLHSLSLLQEEVTNTADLIRTQKRNYDRREEELMERVTRLQGEVEASNSAARQLQQAADESRRELQSIADSAVQAQDRAVHDAQALQTQLARVLPRLAQLEDEQAQRTADLMDTAQQLSALHKKTTSAECVSRKHIDELNQTLEQLLQAHTTLQQTHTSTEATADRLRSQLANVTQELERTTKRVTEQEEELTKVRAQLHELETCTSRVMADDQARLRDSERRLQGLVQRNTALQQECDALQESLQSLRIEHESTVDALNRKSEAFVAQDKLMNHQVRLLRERVSTLEVERQELMSSTESLTAARDRCQRDALSLEHQLEHLQHHLRTSNEHSERLNQEMVQLKTDHSTEVDRLRESITDAQKELAKCRQLLTQAEARQVEQESTHYSLSAEVSALREELRGVRALAEKATEEYRKSKMRQEETVTVLQSQVSQLNEDLRGKEDQVRMLENTSAHQEDTIHGLRQDIAEAMASLKHTRQELLNQKEAAAAAREHHRRDRCELQEKLNDAEDAMAEMTRSQEQYRQRMTSKVELYEVSEQALRGEVCDLRADVARLEEALAATTHRKVTAETHQSRQAQSIKAAESELQTLRSQTVHDMTEIAALKLQLQQRTSEVERCRREAPAQLTSERHLWEVEHMAACDALEEALRQEQQANKDAREARERALAALASKQEDVIAMESKCRSLREKERQLRRRFDAAQSQLTLLEGLAKTTADDLGITLRGLLGDKEGTLVDAAPHSHDISVDSTDSDVAAAVAAIAVSGAAVQTVMDELQRRLSIFTLAAHSLDSEDDQLVELRKALEQQEDAVQLLVEACAGEGLGSTSSATPLRSGTAGVDVVTPGLNNTPTPSFTKSVGAPLASSGAVSTAVVHLRSVLTSAQRVFVQRIGQASSTYVHRVEDHLRTSRQMLRSVMMAMGSYEMVSQPAGRPTTAALSSRHKLQVSATVAELHRRTAALTRAVERMLDLVVRGEGAQSPALCSSPQSLNGNMFEGQLQELRRLFSEAESYVLRPFNELLCVSESPLVRTAASAAVDEESAVGEEPPPPPPPHQSFSCTESDGWGG
ncbi:hypothetical protein JKF63_05060 [Porcisia hertigi]|uniref:Plectin n=1 Tax=Porcisia hertigi TaxID=2761500 RepID=A0A836IJC6_9TRYP|nr:hypothetical protein JKF63_05060 [Porcisia hertigi]